MVGYGEHVGLEGSVSLEGGAVDGYMDIGGGAENPVVTGIAIVMGIVGLGIWWKGQKTGAMLTVAVVVGIEEAGDIGARFDRLWWQIASLVAEIKSHSVRCLEVIHRVLSRGGRRSLSSGQGPVEEDSRKSC